MLTLSQILVVHNGRYSRGVHSMRRLQLELREMDLNLHTLMMKNVPSIELNRKLLQNSINNGRFAAIIAQAAQKNHTAAATTERTRHQRQLSGKSRLEPNPISTINENHRNREAETLRTASATVPGERTGTGHVTRGDGTSVNGDPGRPGAVAGAPDVNQTRSVFTNKLLNRNITNRGLPRYCPSVPPNLSE